MKKLLGLMIGMYLMPMSGAAVNSMGDAYGFQYSGRLLNKKAKEIVEGRGFPVPSFYYFCDKEDRELRVASIFEKLPEVQDLYYHRVCDITYDTVGKPILTRADCSFLLANLKNEINRVFLNVLEIKDILMNNREGYNCTLGLCMQQMDNFINHCQGSSVELRKHLLFKNALVKIYDYRDQFSSLFRQILFRNSHYKVFSCALGGVDGAFTAKDRLQIMAIFNGIEKNCERLVAVIRENM